MKDFDPILILHECCPNPLGDDFRKHFKGSYYYQRVMPLMYCSWGGGFYLQPILLEFEFKKYAQIHASKKTLVLPRWKQEDPKKKITDFEGVTREYRVLAFYICVSFPYKFQPNWNTHSRYFGNELDKSKSSWSLCEAENPINVSQVKHSRNPRIS